MAARKIGITAIFSLGIALMGCEQKAPDDESETASDSEAPVVPSGGVGSSSTTNADATVAVPQVGAINLKAIAEQDESSLLLSGDSDDGACDKQKLGVFGLAVGAACHTSGLASKILLGSESGDFDGDGDIDCGDFVAAKSAREAGTNSQGPGLLLHLMCQGVFLNNDNVVSFAFEDQKSDQAKALAVSFADFPDDVSAVGSWTKGNAASYPANIRIWGGESLAAAVPNFAMGLTDLNTGTLGVEKLGDKDFKVRIDFANRADATGCAGAPSAETCHWQDVRIYSGDGLIENGPPNQFHLKIFADNKEAPTFLALEGRYAYSAETAAKVFAGDASNPNKPDLTGIRHVYFQVVKKATQIWGRLYFMDADGALLHWEMASPTGTIDVFEKFSSEAGVCQNTDSTDWVDCTDIDPSAYAALFEGKDTFEGTTASPVDVDWSTGKPEKAGLCNVNKCVDF